MTWPPYLEPTHGVCKICGADAPLFGVLDFNRSCEERMGVFLPVAGIPIYYCRCPACGFIFTTHFDAWSKDDFLEHIYNDDYEKIDTEYVETRPQQSARLVSEAFAGARETIRILDYGGGNGRCAALLRQNGFDAVSYDPLENDPTPPREGFDLITCFEVVEHLPDPVGSFNSMLDFLKPGGLVLIGTVTVPDDIMTTRLNWWYIGPRNGHISLFSLLALATLFDRFGMRGGSFGSGLHLAFAGDPPDFAKHLLGGSKPRILK